MYGDGQQTRDFVYVGDVVRALQTAMDHCSCRADIFNVCTGTVTTIRDLAKLIGEALGTEPNIAFGPPREADIRMSLGDPSKAWRVLGFAAEADLRAGLMGTLAAT